MTTPMQDLLDAVTNAVEVMSCACDCGEDDCQICGAIKQGEEAIARAAKEPQ